MAPLRGGPGGSQFLFVDGATKLANYGISLETLRALSTRANSDPVQSV